MKFAIQENLLPGRTFRERCQRAKSLGFAGLEVQAEGLEDRLYEVAEALDASGLRIASVHLGKQDGYLSPELEKREAAIATMRQAMATAVDLLAEHVVFVPQWGALTTPNLKPYRSSEEMASELMIWLLRTVSDLA
ncbi:MAG: sugar phosphate isomerase/epimerase, partial [Anaerolineae bacterium]|nr:sugar phosphate isomerase/epimerase [Anaerolineae bacterium]